MKLILENQFWLYKESGIELAIHSQSVNETVRLHYWWLRTHFVCIFNYHNPLDAGWAWKKCTSCSTHFKRWEENTNLMINQDKKFHVWFRRCDGRREGNRSEKLIHELSINTNTWSICFRKPVDDMPLTLFLI